MLESMKNVASTLGTPVGDLARSFASGSTDLARRVGGSAADVARRIGPKRVLIGLAIAGVVVGGTILLVRYLRDRDDEKDAANDTDATTKVAEARHTDGVAHPRDQLSRAERKRQRAAMAH